MPRTVRGISLFMGPDNLGAEDDLESAIIGFIGAARSTLDVAVQELESRPIARALIAAKKQGIKVRLVLEGDYLGVDHARAEPFEKGGKNEENRSIHAALLRANIAVRSDYNGSIFHQKFIVRDIEKGNSAVLTGSTNFTPTGVHKNLNHLIIVDGKKAAREFATEFAEIWDGSFGTSRLRHDPKPRNLRVAGIRVKVLFAPDHAPEMEIMKQMLKAKERIDFAIFTFSQSSGIDDVMLVLIKAGIQVRGALDKGQGGRPWAPTKMLNAVGGNLKLVKKGGGLNKLHHKLMIIDRQLVIGGSFNYTGPANRLNDENIVILGDLDETRPESIATQKQFASYALAEIDRIIANHT
ncbi:MAG: phospholipase [Proteobacteria bacterium]|nr:phospholipase [Pseudomonadota bacterium]